MSQRSFKEEYEKTLKDCLEYENAICKNYKISISTGPQTDCSRLTQSARSASRPASKNTSGRSPKQTNNNVNLAQSSSGKIKQINTTGTPSSPKAGKKPTELVSVKFDGCFQELSEYQSDTDIVASPKCCYQRCTKKSADAPIAVHACKKWMHAECFVDCVVEQRKNNQQLKCPACGEPFFIPS